MFLSSFSGKKVLITGNTGFKGSWLSEWLLYLDAEVYGISNNIPSSPSHFELLHLEKRTHHQYIDINDSQVLLETIASIQPDFIFHLAAQPIVSTSYAQPLLTLETNILGTAGILEYARIFNPHSIIVLITSDKCYQNNEWIWGYRENDRLGGKDIYSASKACAENIIYAYYNSFVVGNDNVNYKISSVRAGNVIGGGDWSRDRIVVDCFLNWSQSRPVEIRSPLATRPWQHVLEPLSGYLQVASHLYHSKLNGFHSFNFGPSSEDEKTVLQLTKDLLHVWDCNTSDDDLISTTSSNLSESRLLKLNCDKALSLLNWRPTLTYLETVNYVSAWYKEFYNQSYDPAFTKSQIIDYCNIAASRNVNWSLS